MQNKIISGTVRDALYGRKPNLNDIKEFINNSGTKQLNNVIRELSSALIPSGSFKTLLTLADDPNLGTLIAWASMEIPVFQTTVVGNLKIVDYINDGLISTKIAGDKKIIIKIPWIFLYRVWKPIDLPVIKLFESPTKLKN